jgi:hypothetical protein
MKHPVLALCLVAFFTTIALTPGGCAGASNPSPDDGGLEEAGLLDTASNMETLAVSAQNYGLHESAQNF